MATYSAADLETASVENGWLEFSGVREPFLALPIEDGDEVVTSFGTLTVTDDAFVALTLLGEPMVLSRPAFLTVFEPTEPEEVFVPPSWEGVPLPFSVFFSLFEASKLAGESVIEPLTLDGLRDLVRLASLLSRGELRVVVNGVLGTPDLPVTVTIEDVDCVFDEADEEAVGDVYTVTVGTLDEPEPEDD